jgi:hypothetical protein
MTQITVGRNVRAIVAEPPGHLYIPFSEHQQQIAQLEAKNKRLKKALKEAQELTDLICNSGPDTPIRGEIESRALDVGHLIVALDQDKS